MKDPRTHLMTLAGIVLCYGKDIKGSIEQARRDAERLVVTWRPDEANCLACQLAAKKQKPE